MTAPAAAAPTARPAIALRPGRVVFAATFVALGLYGLATGRLGAVWAPVPKAWPGRETLAWASALISLAAGLGLLWRRAAPAAAATLALTLLAWMLAFKAAVIVAHPAAAAAWESCGETAVLAAAAWVLFAQVAPAAPVLGGRAGARLARSLYALALIAFGASHFAYIPETAALVPPWLPAHPALVMFTGGAYIAAGAAILLSPFWREAGGRLGEGLGRVAAILVAVQIGLFTLLVWAPKIAAGASAADWSEAVISFALTAAAWALAESQSSPSPPGEGA
ncbi:MAG TPA: hypothetical protein VGS12_12420 [Caulobacteraceae bacterium]|nr:hypothetical protein [Caulobacteraceae bacterium]